MPTYDCENCPLDGQRVPGRGSKKPVIAFIGEAPGKTELERGQPFVGEAGKVISQVVQFVGVPENQVYYTNVCLCRPPENRDPSAAETKACWPRLQEELQKLNPQLVIALGKVPARVLFPGNNLKEGRGRFLQGTSGHEGLITYHPAATLYHRGDTILPFIISDVRKAWRKISGEAPHPDYTNPDTLTWTAWTEEDVGLLLERLGQLEDGAMVSLDWETTGLRPGKDVGYCMSLSWKEGTGVSIPDYFVRRFAGELSGHLKRFTLTGFNCAMFDSQFNKVIRLPWWFDHDAMMLHAALDERPQQRSLENLTVQELDAPPYESQMLTHSGIEKKELLTLPEEVVHEYACRDADWSLRLTKFLLPQVKKEQGLLEAYNRLLVPGAHVLGDIHQKGFWVDRERLQEVTEEHRQKAEKKEQELTEITENEDFNPRSHPQVQAHLWDTLGLKEPRLHSREPRSADAETLEALLKADPEQPFVKALQEYRTTFTLYSRYLRGLDEYIETDGRIRCSIHLDRAETGRLSTSDPSLHQIPRDSTIRSIYGAPPGFVLIQADYEQAEIRTAAHVANDRKLIELLKTGQDFHTMMASHAFKLPVDEVSPGQRQAAKDISFGLLYLMSNEGLMAMTGLPRNQAQEVVKNYKALMPDVQKLIEETKRQVKSQRYVESISGRRRRFPLITSKNLSGLHREAVNFRLGQCPASDLTLRSTITLHYHLDQYYPETGIVLTVHDSIIVECPEPLVDPVSEDIFAIMEVPPFDTEVPFPVEQKIGKRWGEGEKRYSA